MADAPPSIAELLEHQRTGGATAAEIVERRIEMIEADAGGVRAVVELDAEGARAAAEALDRRRAAGRPMGPLHGVPVTAKTAFAVAGLHASAGTAETRVLATEDAPAVARLRAAGAVVLGTTNLPPGLDGYFSDNLLAGRTGNPWDVGRTPGGSSGGSAAAVAAGWSSGDLGSDLTGSIRVPAGWCGVAGHRPSNGVVSKRGHLPWPIGTLLETPLSVAGPLARSADDLGRLLEVLARDDTEATTLAPAVVHDLAGLRVGVWRDEPDAACDAEVDAAIDAFLAALTAAGSRLVPLRRTVLGTEESEDLFGRLLGHEIAYGAGGGAPVADVWADWHRQRVVRDEWERTIEGVDVVVAPVLPITAPRHGVLQADPALGLRVGRWSRMANLAAGPSTVVPIGLGRESGLPVAVQLLAGFGRDRDTIAVARLLEREGVVRPLVPPLPA